MRSWSAGSRISRSCSPIQRMPQARAINGIFSWRRHRARPTGSGVAFIGFGNYAKGVLLPAFRKARAASR